MGVECSNGEYIVMLIMIIEFYNQEDWIESDLLMYAQRPECRNMWCKSIIFQDRSASTCSELHLETRALQDIDVEKYEKKDFKKDDFINICSRFKLPLQAAWFYGK